MPLKMRQPGPMSGLMNWQPTNNQEDPLGVGVMQRARQNRMAYDMANPQGSTLLVDPQWDAFRQALQERGVTKIAGGASPAGSDQLRGEAPMEREAAGIPMGSGGQAFHAALAGLKKRPDMGPLYQTHEQWQESMKRRGIL